MTGTVRIATWNLMRARPGSSGRTAALLAHMDAISPDVWVLTETFRDLRPGPDYTLVASSTDAPDREAARGECWTAIWSRVPGMPVELAADPERTAAARVQFADAEPLLIVGTVLPWLSDTRYAPLRGGDAFCAVLARQAGEWRELQKKHSDAGMCVAGDFNQDLAASHYYGSARGRLALRRALDGARLECLTAGAGDPLAEVPGHAAIDHVCVSRNVIPMENPAVNAWPEPPLDRSRLTDHFGVVADLPLGGRNPA